MRPERLVWRSATRANGRPTYGDLAFASLLIAVLSGVLLAVPYDIRQAYQSVALLRLTNPSAGYFRNVHYWSAQLFLIFTAVHIWDSFWKSSERRVASGAWARLTLSIPLAAFVMVSGFMLKGDAEGVQAWRIISTVTASLPVVGRVLSTLLFGTGSDQQVLYVHHIATASIFLWLLVVEHARAVWPRPVATLVTFGPVAVAALFLSPGLHDGFSPIVKGPWYFLGLQETLRWLSHPVWAVVAGLVLLLAVLVLRWTPPRLSRGLKIALATALAAYLVLTGVGSFFRGANWSFVRPGLAGGPGLQVTRPDTLFGAPIGAPETRAIPVVLGRPEGCLACHAGVKGFSPAHDPAAIGCASCHAGDPFTLDKAAAHRGMVLVPGNLADAARTCGTSQCHPAIIGRVDRSIMTTMAGIISVDRTVFGETGRGAAPPRVEDLGRTPADTHLRQLCASCHVGRAKTELGPIHEDSRGGGCNACHLAYSPGALDALHRYQQPAGEADRQAPLEHPSLSLAIGSDHCFGCHSRSGRISTSYAGWMETERASPDPLAPDRHRTLEDGRVFVKDEPDIHEVKKLECVDCHTSREAMGDGTVHARKWEQVEVACEDCHLVGPAETVPAARLDGESLRILTLRKQPATGRAFLAARATGQPLVNAFLDAQGRPSMYLKLTGEVMELKRPAAVCLQGGGHARLSCVSCHTKWAPTCSTCHTAFDPRGTGYDQLDDVETKGEWVETARGFRADPPTLGIRTLARADGTTADVVDTFVPGMILSIEGGAPATIFHRLYARAFSHTIAQKGRSCESCHNDPEALGYGRGALQYAREGDHGRWTFTPEMAPSVYDGLPADAWIPFLGTRTGMVSTRDDVRPFSVAEQKAILTTGACLTCHAGDSRVMQNAIADWPGTLARVSPKCLLPKWE